MSSNITSLQHLSVDVRNMLAMRLTPKDISQCQKVCKAWNKALKHPRISFSILNRTYPLVAVKVRQFNAHNGPLTHKITTLYLKHGIKNNSFQCDWISWFISLDFKGDLDVENMLTSFHTDDFLQSFIANYRCNHFNNNLLYARLENLLSNRTTPLKEGNELAHKIVLYNQNAKNSINLLKLLKNTGFHLNEVNNQGKTLLHTALSYLHNKLSDPLPLVEWLLNNGVDPNITDCHGHLPGSTNRIDTMVPRYNWVQAARVVKKLQGKRLRTDIPRHEELLDAVRNGRSVVIKRAKISEISGQFIVENMGKHWPLTEALTWGNLATAKAICDRLDDTTLFCKNNQRGWLNPLHQTSVIGHTNPKKSHQIALFIGKLLKRCLKSHTLDPETKSSAACYLASTLLRTYLAKVINLNTFTKSFDNYLGPLFVDKKDITRLIHIHPEMLLFPDWEYRDGHRTLIESYCTNRPFWKKLQPVWSAIFKCVEKSGRIDILSKIWWKTLQDLTSIEQLEGCITPNLLSLTLTHEGISTTWLHLLCKVLPYENNLFSSSGSLKLFLESLPKESLDFSKLNKFGNSPLHTFF